MRSLEDIVRLSARWFSRIPEGFRAEALELAVEIAWLAVARRDYGEGGMEEVVRALEAML